MSMSSRLKSAMKARNFTVSDLMERLDISKAGLYFLLDGTTTPDKVRFSTVSEICKAMRKSSHVCWFTCLRFSSNRCRYAHFGAIRSAIRNRYLFICALWPICFAVKIRKNLNNSRNFPVFENNLLFLSSSLDILYSSVLELNRTYFTPRCRITAFPPLRVPAMGF